MTKREFLDKFLVNIRDEAIPEEGVARISENEGLLSVQLLPEKINNIAIRTEFLWEGSLLWMHLCHTAKGGTLFLIFDLKGGEGV